MSVAEGSLAVLRELYRYCSKLSAECDRNAAYHHVNHRGREAEWYGGQAAGARVVQREIERLAAALKTAAEGSIKDNGNNRGRAPDRNGRPGAINS